MATGFTMNTSEDLVESVKTVFLGAGATWVLWLLIALFCVSLLLTIERILYFRTRTGHPDLLAAALDRHLSLQDVQSAIHALERDQSSASVVALAGLRSLTWGPAAVERKMASALATERNQLERWLVYLGTIGSNAPFVGLFGTVIGVIHAFEELGHETSDAVSQSVSHAVMSGIAEALVATAVGILVALPAVAAYNYFQRRLSVLLGSTEALTQLVLAYLLRTPEARDGSTAT